MLTTVHLALNINDGVLNTSLTLGKGQGDKLIFWEGGGGSGETMMFCSQGTLLNSSVMAECSECRPESLGVSVPVHVFL